MGPAPKTPVSPSTVTVTTSPRDTSLGTSADTLRTLLAFALIVSATRLKVNVRWHRAVGPLNNVTVWV